MRRDDWLANRRQANCSDSSRTESQQVVEIACQLKHGEGHMQLNESVSTVAELRSSEIGPRAALTKLSFGEVALTLGRTGM